MVFEVGGGPGGLSGGGFRFLGVGGWSLSWDLGIVEVGGCTGGLNVGDFRFLKG